MFTAPAVFTTSLTGFLWSYVKREQPIRIRPEGGRVKGAGIKGEEFKGRGRKQETADM